MFLFIFHKLFFRERLEVILGMYDIFTQNEAQPETYFVSEIHLVGHFNFLQTKTFWDMRFLTQ